MGHDRVVVSADEVADRSAVGIFQDLDLELWGVAFTYHKYPDLALFPNQNKWSIV
jgi:hypothetical protein